MTDISVKEFVSELESLNSDDFILSTIDQSPKGWIKKADVSYLMTKIDSKLKSKCIKMEISSYIDAPNEITVGDQVISLIQSFRNGERFPDELNICKIYSEEDRNEIKEWWKHINGS